MEIRKLLFVTKFNDLSFRALQSLLCLRTAALNHVVLTRVIEREKVAMQRGVGYKKSEAVRLREAANIRFIDWAEDLFEQGLEVGVYILVGNLIHQVIDAAQKEAADLIVIGRSHKHFLDQLYSGSDVAEIIRQSSVPVLVYKPLNNKIGLLENPFKRLLLATDWSPASKRAEAYLTGLKNVIEDVTVIHVVDEKKLQGSAMEIQKVRRELRADLEAIADSLKAEGIETSAHLYVGDPEAEIEKAAGERRASMIVMGSSSKSAFRERWLGSTTRNIAEKSDYPTLVIPPGKELTGHDPSSGRC